jgi:hypothetical protein
LSSSVSAGCLFRGSRRSGPRLAAIAGAGLARLLSLTRAKRFVSRKSAGGTRRRIGFLRRVHPTRHVASRALASPFPLGAQPTTRQTVPVHWPVISTAPSATSSARPYAVAIARIDRRDRLCSPPPELPPFWRCSGEDRPRRSASHGALVPSAILQQRCACPELPASGRCRFDVSDGRGRR